MPGHPGRQPDPELTVNIDEAQFGIRGNISEVNLANAAHTLIIAPSSAMSFTLIGFDHLIYTASLPNKKSHVGAIVGGVIGGVVLTIGALFIALFARRRKLIIRRNQRKISMTLPALGLTETPALAANGRHPCLVPAHVLIKPPSVNAAALSDGSSDESEEGQLQNGAVKGYIRVVNMTARWRTTEKAEFLSIHY
ncbi:hypothetical protein C8F04DRAFT_1192804 [Mycena alexandri]|uniref:Uncharacterized protein n=1 Tax=Mycena alexandri TaxID=1745969 RepID=A0AAD6WSU3_9AGAR|nr:hypothetical protein C8F04DRAFT_1192804 [Mycena alexandri]